MSARTRRIVSSPTVISPLSKTNAGMVSVPVDKDDRVLLRERTGTDTIPVLVAPGKAPLAGEEAILTHLDNHEPVPAEARAHRLKAEKARRRYLDEECECPPQPVTR